MMEIIKTRTEFMDCQEVLMVGEAKNGWVRAIGCRVGCTGVGWLQLGKGKQGEACGWG